MAVHYAAGRLSADELEVRLYAAVRAETVIDLRPLVIDLAARSTRASAPVPARRPGPTPWRTVDLFALVMMLGILSTGLIALVVFGVVNGAVAGFACGITAAAGGVSAAYLIHRLLAARRQADHEAGLTDPAAT